MSIAPPKNAKWNGNLCYLVFHYHRCWGKDITFYWRWNYDWIRWKVHWSVPPRTNSNPTWSDYILSNYIRFHLAQGSESGLGKFQARFFLVNQNRAAHFPFKFPSCNVFFLSWEICLLVFLFPSKHVKISDKNGEKLKSQGKHKKMPLTLECYRFPESDYGGQSSIKAKHSLCHFDKFEFFIFYIFQPFALGFSLKQKSIKETFIMLLGKKHFNIFIFPP